MSYAFWCSNCKLSHAGECPPAKFTISVPTDLDVNVEKVKGMFLKAVQSAQNSWKVPILVAPPVPPAIGSTWHSEIRKQKSDPWKPGNKFATFEVMSATPNGMVRVEQDPGRGTWWCNIDCWLTDGFYDVNVGHWLRFVP
jgi:hypothetical protein